MTPDPTLPTGDAFRRRLARRHQRGRLWSRFFALAVGAGLLALLALLGNVVNQTFGLRAIVQQVDPATLADGRDLTTLTTDELAAVLAYHLPFARARVILRDAVLEGEVQGERMVSTPMRDLLAGRAFPDAAADLTLRDLTPELLARILVLNLERDGTLGLIGTEIVGRELVGAWTLLDSLLQRAAIEAEVTREHPGARLEFASWLTPAFLSRTMADSALDVGIRTALLGTLWLMAVTLAIAVPLGVGAAIYLEEYASGGWLSRLIETNIRNLAGVPSIIYGLLGLAVFVRALGEVTGGRSILSAALTMALLILPLLIINAQEAIRAVPSSLREASHGLGATQWQTIRRVILPTAMPGILTGVILATSRAIGETAPLIVVGASTFILSDPNGPLSKFTALPIQIYDWAKRPEAEFRDVAAATIVVLLALLLVLNAAAIVLRQRMQRSAHA